MEPAASSAGRSAAGHASSSGRAHVGSSSSSSGGDGDFVNAAQRTFFGLLNAYVDVLHTARPYPTGALQGEGA